MQNLTGKRIPTLPTYNLSHQKLLKQFSSLIHHLIALTPFKLIRNGSLLIKVLHSDQQKELSRSQESAKRNVQCPPASSLSSPFVLPLPLSFLSGRNTGQKSMILESSEELESFPSILRAIDEDTLTYFPQHEKSCVSCPRSNFPRPK